MFIRLASRAASVACAGLIVCGARAVHADTPPVTPNPPATPAPATPAIHGGATVDAKTQALLQTVQATTLALTSLTAYFDYTEDSAKNQQTTLGAIRLMRPNFARVVITYSPKPNFPNLVACDGKQTYLFVPSAYSEDHNGSFSNAPYDPIMGASAASGIFAGYGTIDASPAAPDGSTIRLWDALPFSAFFDPRRAIQQNMSVNDPDTLEYEGVQVVDGVSYQVLRRDIQDGNIAGGETTPFVLRIFIGPDFLIHIYRLEFVSHGKPGVETFTLKNINENVPMDAASFKFTPP